MNENLDLTKILKDCPEGTKLHSPLFGDVELVSVSLNEDAVYGKTYRSKKSLLSAINEYQNKQEEKL